MKLCLLCKTVKQMLGQIPWSLRDLIIIFYTLQSITKSPKCKGVGFPCLLAQCAQCHHAQVLAELGLASWVMLPDVCRGKGATLVSSPQHEAAFEECALTHHTLVPEVSDCNCLAPAQQRFTWRQVQVFDNHPGSEQQRWFSLCVTNLPGLLEGIVPGQVSIWD